MDLNLFLKDVWKECCGGSSFYCAEINRCRDRRCMPMRRLKQYTKWDFTIEVLWGKASSQSTEGYRRYYKGCQPRAFTRRTTCLSYWETLHAFTADTPQRHEVTWKNISPSYRARQTQRRNVGRQGFHLEKQWWHFRGIRLGFLFWINIVFPGLSGSVYFKRTSVKAKRKKLF